MRFLPREEKFYELFLDQVKLISQAARLLVQGAEAGNARLAQAAKEISELEKKADEIIHDIFKPALRRPTIWPKYGIDQQKTINANAPPEANSLSAEPS